MNKQNGKRATKTRRRTEDQNTHLDSHSKMYQIEKKKFGQDYIQGYWSKKFTSIHEKLEIEMNRYLRETNMPQWITKEKTTLIQKDPQKRTVPNNYRPICLPMTRKILTAQIREEIQYMQGSRWLFPKEQKWCHKEQEE